VKYAFYPGCSLESTAWDYAASTRAVCAALEVSLFDVPGWSCCGSTPAHGTNDTLSVALPVLNLKKAAAVEGQVMTACAACYARLRTANHRVLHDAEERSRVERVVGAPYDGSVPVYHLLDVLKNQVGLSRIRDRVVNPLKGLRVACYYGCLLSRPPRVVAFDDPENPSCMEDLVEAMGAEPVAWPYRTECCGAGLSLTHAEVVCRLSHRILSMARNAGADCVAVACPMCQTNLDLRQADAARAHGPIPPTSVPYITQLLGLTFGLIPHELGLQALSLSPVPRLKERMVPQLTSSEERRDG
jgi:heterodisulfide reductase subunit B2